MDISELVAFTGLSNSNNNSNILRMMMMMLINSAEIDEDIPVPVTNLECKLSEGSCVARARLYI